MKKVAVFGSFVVDLMARSPHLPVPGETVKGSMFKMGPGGKGFNQCVAAHKAGADVVMMTKVGKLIGMYSGNNITGDGVCNAVADSNVGDKFINVAVDSDDIEIQALKNGVLDAIIVQDAYAQGYKCMENALQTLITGKNPESKKQVNCPPVVITKDNMEQSDMQDLLDPTRLKK